MLQTRTQRHLSEHQKQTAFLRQCLLYDDSAESRQLADDLAELQREERSVRRAVGAAAILTALAGAGFVYATALVGDFPARMSDFFSGVFVKGCLGLGLGALLCLLALLGLARVYRNNLDRRRTECRRFLTKILEVRFGHPASRRVRDRHPDSARPQAASNPVAPHGSQQTAT